MTKLCEIEKIFTLFEEREVLSLNHLDFSDLRKPIVDYLKYHCGHFYKKIRYRALHYVILGDILFRKSIDSSLLACLHEEDAYTALAKVHEGICGSHQVGKKMKCTLNWQRFYWPTMIKDWIEYTKASEECQKHIGIQHMRAIELYLIVRPWPFQGLAFDIIRFILHLLRAISLFWLLINFWSESKQWL